MKQRKNLGFFDIVTGVLVLFTIYNFNNSQLVNTSSYRSHNYGSAQTNSDSKNIESYRFDSVSLSLIQTSSHFTKLSLRKNFNSFFLVQASIGWIVIAAGILGFTIIIIAIIFAIIETSIVRIKNNEIGLVYKKLTLNLSHQKLPPGRRIALNGEEGWQADPLTSGRHFGYWPWMYNIRRVPMIEIPQGQIALVVANEGKPLPNHRRLGKIVPCDDFQDPRAFLLNDGEKGQQMGILKPGRYGIHSIIFNVIKQDNSADFGIISDSLSIYKIKPGYLGIVTTNEGKLLPNDDKSRQFIAPSISGHNNFQDVQTFINSGGYKGIQEDILTEGEWTLNPWFVDVKQVPITRIHAGTVGVVIAQDGKQYPGTGENNLVASYSNYRGIWDTVLTQGTELVNPLLQEIEIVPTNKISLEWSDEIKPIENYDSKLKAIRLYSKDGFDFKVDVIQVIRILPENAPKVIALVGQSPDVKKQTLKDDLLGISRYPSIRNLIVKVLQPIVTNEFLNQAKKYSALDFHEERETIQWNVTKDIRNKLIAHGIESEETLIDEIYLPTKLQEILRNRAIRDIESEELEYDLAHEEERKSLAYAKALTALQDDLAKSEQAVKIAGLQAQADKLKGTVQAEILQAIVNVLGRDGYLTQEQIKNLGNLKLPNTLIMSGSDGSAIDSLQHLLYPLLLQQNNPIPIISEPGKHISSVLPSAMPGKSLFGDEPRFPLVLLLDTSEMLPVKYLDQLIEGTSILRREIMLDLKAAHQVDISIITFGGAANIVQIFTPIDQFSTPQLQINGNNVLYQGLELALDRVNMQKTAYYSQSTPFYKPWIVLLTCGKPLEYKQSVINRVTRAINNKDLIFLKIGIVDASIDDIEQIVTTGFPPVLLEESKSQKFFDWLAISIKGLFSRAVGEKFSLPPMDSWAKRENLNHK